MTEIDLAAANKHHVGGTSYHWKHGYIPLDARTAVQKLDRIQFVQREDAMQRIDRIHEHLTSGIAGLHPVGARGSMIVTWSNRVGQPGGRHIFNWEHTPDGVRFHDAQGNKEYTKESNPWNSLHDPTPAEIFRMDDKAIISKAGDAVRSAKEHTPYLDKISAAAETEKEARTSQTFRTSPENAQKYIAAKKAVESAKASARRKFYKNLGKGGSEW